MSTTFESAIEAQFIEQLKGIDYAHIKISNEDDLTQNLRDQLEKFNCTVFSKTEFRSILAHLSRGTIFEKAEILRDSFPLRRDDGSVFYVKFLACNRRSGGFRGNTGSEGWCNNIYQVASQIRMSGAKKGDRYDVTILINGLPLIQVELKRSSTDLALAFKQINGYQLNSYGSGSELFQYIQLFIISNSVNTRYYANNSEMSYEQTFCWSDQSNKIINSLNTFTDAFLKPCHVSEIICRYIVLATTDKRLMVLRPYQYYAVRGIIDLVQKHSDRASIAEKRVEHNVQRDNGYIWHTTGSGKTLTSFKASQIVSQIKDVHKVVFVVDRKDLDYQTMKEFNSFEEGSVDGTSHTGALIDRLRDRDNNLVVTTIQKLDRAVSILEYSKHIDALREQKIVFIFDECHRSQFGKTHKEIKKFFKNNQMIGFTGTPIFDENSITSRIEDAKGNIIETPNQTTEHLFGKCLHQYVINHAIGDKNVLGFAVEYIGRSGADGVVAENSRNEVDIAGSPMLTEETKGELESDGRIEKVAEYITTHHEVKTQKGNYNAIFAVSSIPMLIKYYKVLKGMKDEGTHNLKIATIFSYSQEAAKALTEDKESATLSTDEGSAAPSDSNISTTNKEHLETFMGHYNETYGSSFSLGSDKDRGFDAYRVDISHRVKRCEIDILLVVDMFLTGFDSKTLNTIYVDKNLKYHGLIQAFSRTNRIEKPSKTHGNVVVFRNLKGEVDEAIRLFSRSDSGGKAINIVVEGYDNIWREFKAAFIDLIKLAPDPSSVAGFRSESDKLEFARKFRDVMRLHSVASSFVDFQDDIKGSVEGIATSADLLKELGTDLGTDLGIDTSISIEQLYADYTGAYVGIKEMSQDKYDSLSAEADGQGSDELGSDTGNLDDADKDALEVLVDMDYELELLHRDEINVDYILNLLKQSVDTEAPETVDETIERIRSEIDQTPHLIPKRDLIIAFIKDQGTETAISSVDIKNRYDTFADKQRKHEIGLLCAEHSLDRASFDSLLESFHYSGKKPLNIDVAGAIIPKLSFMERTALVAQLQRELSRLKEKYY